MVGQIHFKGLLVKNFYIILFAVLACVQQESYSQASEIPETPEISDKERDVSATPVGTAVNLSSDKSSLNKQEDKKLIIKKIEIEGNKHVKKEVLLMRLPYKIGMKFDPAQSATALNNLYDLGYFRQISLEGEKLSDTAMKLIVCVEEKKLLEKIEFKGNKALRTSKIKEKLDAKKITTIDEESMQKIASRIKTLYKEENRHLVEIKTQLIPNKKNPDKASAIFTISEGPKTSVARVYFVGNTNIPERKLRTAVFTREDWLLSFTDSAGTYQEEALEVDKHKLEYLYRDHGFLMAKVYKTKVSYSKDKRKITVTFFINEGDQYHVRSIKAPGDEIFGQDELLPCITIESQKPYSQTKLVQSINKLKELWGEKGYIYADVYPQVVPDEKSHNVDVTFHVERGKKMYVNRIVVTGNNETRDKVIRRQLNIVEGDLITSTELRKSKDRVEYLSFFERDGVNWKIHRITDELADLEMNVKEAKTGNLNFMVSYGSDQYNTKPTIKGSVAIEKSNILGLGYDAGGLIQATRRHLQRLELHFFDPNILDSDISGSYLLYKRWDEYDQWTYVDKIPIQKIMGVNTRFGFPLKRIDKQLQAILDLGVEDIWNNKPSALGRYGYIFEPIVRRTFQEGTLKWIGVDLVKDTRNHQIYPRSGYKITFSNKWAPAAINKQFSFLRTELEGSCYTALIGQDSLVLAVRAKVGRITELSDNKIIPYKELFHMGGQTTVRGFTWGGIGPAWRLTNNPLGARNAVLFTTELVFPLIEDYSMKGHVFYDTGAGWDTPKKDITDHSLIKRDSFHLRHSIGIGLNLIKPIPAKIDWGFKLDRKRSEHESPNEFHLSMNYAW
jgi:outer membrane protein insertion porin family